MAIYDLADKKARDPDKNYASIVEELIGESKEITTILQRSTIPADHILWSRAREVRNKLLDLRATDAVPPSPDSKDSLKSSINKSSYKITPLTVPHFSGRVEDWLPFWREFQHSVHNRKDLTEGSRLAYLKQSMDDPELKRSISDRSDEDGAYDNIVREL